MEKRPRCENKFSFRFTYKINFPKLLSEKNEDVRKMQKKKKIVKWKQCYQEQKKKKSKFFQNEFADCGIEREHFPRASGS